MAASSKASSSSRIISGDANDQELISPPLWRHKSLLTETQPHGNPTTQESNVGKRGREIDHGVAAAVRTNVDGAHKREGEREDGAGSGAGMLGQS